MNRTMPSLDQAAFSNLIDLKLFFEKIDDYVILKLPEHFPNYRDFADIDILCYNPKEILKYIRYIGSKYENQGFVIRVQQENDHTHIDFYPPGADRLNFRFDLIGALDVYRKFSVDSRYHLLVLASRQVILRDGIKIQIPAQKHELAIRLLEYLEWGAERPSKAKHLDYIIQKKDLSFIDVVNKYTNLSVGIKRDGATSTIQASRKNELDPPSTPY